MQWPMGGTVAGETDVSSQTGRRDLSIAGRLFGWLCLCLALAGLFNVAPATAGTDAPAAAPELVVQVGHDGLVEQVLVSADGRLLLTSGNHTAQLWDIATAREIRRFRGIAGELTSVGLSADGSRILTGDAKGMIGLWDAATGREIRRFEGHGKLVSRVAFSPDGRLVLSGGFDDTACLWNADTGEQIQRFKGHRSWLADAVLSADGRRVLTGSEDGTARLWDAATGKPLRRLAGHKDTVSRVAFSGEGRRLLTASQETVSLWDAATGRRIRQFKGHQQIVNAVTFSPDDRLVLTASQDGTARLWDAATGRERMRFGGRVPLGMTSACFMPDASRILTGDYKTVRLWDAATAKELQRFQGYGAEVSSVTVSADGRQVLTGSWDATARLWDTATGTARRLTGHRMMVFSAAFSPDGRHAVTGAWEKQVRIWDTAGGNQTLSLDANAELVHAVAFSPDGRMVVAGGGKYTDFAVRIFDAASGQEIRRLTGHDSAVKAAVFSPDGRYVLTGSDDKTARLWDAETGREIQRFTGHTWCLTSAAFSPDGRYVLTGSDDKTARLWDAATGQEVGRFTGHDDLVLAVAFSADGRQVLTGSRDTTVRLWDAATGRQTRCLAGHESWVDSVAFSADGRHIFSASYDKTTRVWEAGTGRELCRLAGFKDGTWVVVAPDGRFDTNDLEEVKGLHWVMPDEPFRPLPLEIFMRDYYEPRLLTRLLNGEALKPLRNLAELNRTQPEVAITQITAQPDGRLSVAVQVAGVRDGTAGQDRAIAQPTDVFDLRLFRDGQLVGTSVRHGPPASGADIQAWRRTHRIDADPDGRRLISFGDIQVPAGQGKTAVEFSAYAFNEDRVKSQTCRQIFPLDGQRAPAKGRAYVIGVGVNTSDNPAWALNFAANDARSLQRGLAQGLAHNPAYEEVVLLSLVSDRHARPGETPARKASLKAVLDRLAGKAGAPEVVQGIAGADRLKPATPNDLVLITFSGHGHTGERGVFYLFPEDIGQGQTMAVTDELLARCISSDELADWLEGVDAGDLALVVDACHSAASVEGQGFKPGPMGSRGLGQLAFDKGMRILAASQADDVALESDRLEQGLLSYALASDGLDKGGADFRPMDRVVTLSEWLHFGTERVPALYAEVIAGRLPGARGITKIEGTGEMPARKRSLQQPALFDFTRNRRDVQLLVK